MTSTSHGVEHRIALSYKDVCGILGVGRRTIEKLVSMGKFPKPRRIPGTSLLRFSAAEVQDWFEKQPVDGSPELEE